MASKGTVVGTGYVLLVPKMDGFQREVNKSLKGMNLTVPSFKDGFAKAGTDAGKAFSNAFKSVVEKSLGTSIASIKGLSDQLSKLQKASANTKTNPANVERSTILGIDSDWATVASRAAQSFRSSFSAGIGSIAGDLVSMSGGWEPIFLAAGRKCVEAFAEWWSRLDSVMMGAAQDAAGVLGNVFKNALTTAGSAVVDVSKTELGFAAGKLGLGFLQDLGNTISTGDVALGTILGNMFSNALSTAQSTITGAIERTDTISLFPRIMAGMSVNADASAASVQRMADAIDGLPTALDDITSFTVKVFPAFNKDLSAATTAGIAFNDMMVAGGKSAAIQANALEQWSQMVNNAKVDLLSFRTVNEAAPAQIQQVAESFGYKNYLELYNHTRGSQGALKLEEAGEQILEVSDIMQRIVELNEEGANGYASFAEQAKTASHTIGTALTNVSNRLKKAQQSAMEWVGVENIFNAIERMSKGIGPSMQSALGWLDSMDIKGLVARLGSELGGLWDNLGKGSFDKLVDAGRKAIESLVGLAQPAVSLVVENTLTKAAPLMDKLSGMFDAIREGAPGIGQQFTDVANAFVGFNVTSWDAAIDMWTSLVAAFAPELPGILDAMSTITQALGNFVGNLAPEVAPLVSGIATNTANFLHDNAEYFETVVRDALPHIKTAYDAMLGIGDTLAPVLDKVVTTFGPVWDQFFETAGQLVDKLVNDVIEPHLQPLADLVSKIVDDLATYIPEWLDTLEPYIDPTLDAIQAAIDRLLPLISGILDDLAPMLPDLIEMWVAGKEFSLGFDVAKFKLFNGLIKGVYDFFKGIADFVKSITDKLDELGGFLGGFFTTGIVPAERPFANGGRVTGPTRALIGEAGYDEYVVPLTRQSLEPLADGLAEAMGRGSGEVTVNVSIDTVINNDTATDARTLSETIGRYAAQQLKAQGVA